VKLLTDVSYDDALVAITTDNRAVYDYDLMVECIMNAQKWEYADAVEWIEYNTLRALPYMGEDGPIVIHRLDEE